MKRKTWLCVVNAWHFLKCIFCHAFTTQSHFFRTIWKKKLLIEVEHNIWFQKGGYPRGAVGKTPASKGIKHFKTRKNRVRIRSAAQIFSRKISLPTLVKILPRVRYRHWLSRNLSKYAYMKTDGPWNRGTRSKCKSSVKNGTVEVGRRVLYIWGSTPFVWEIGELWVAVKKRKG